MHLYSLDIVIAVQGPLTPCRDEVPCAVHVIHREAVAVGPGVVETAVDVVVSTAVHIPDPSGSVVYAGPSGIALVGHVLGMDVGSRSGAGAADERANSESESHSCAGHVLFEQLHPEVSLPGAPLQRQFEQTPVRTY